MNLSPEQTRKLTASILTLALAGDTDTLAESTLRDLRALGQVEGNSELLKKETQDRIHSQLRDIDGISYERVLAQVLVHTKDAVRPIHPQLYGTDFLSGWGFRPLPIDDPVFDEPDYLLNMLKVTDQTAVGTTQFDPVNARRIFENAFHELAPPNTAIMEYALTGSDANNLLSDIVQWTAKEMNSPSFPRVEMLHLSGSYGGTRGPIRGRSSISEFLGGYNLSNLEIPAVLTTLPPAEQSPKAQLLPQERRILRNLKLKIGFMRLTGTAVGGIFIEPVLGRGVRFYNVAFLRALRKLCDDYYIPIFADEVLTGGGRTGKFFAYQHYPDFEPDFITFGKTMQVAGVALVYRTNAPLRLRNAVMAYPHQNIYGTTITSLTEPLLKGAQILKAIAERKLMNNAKTTGAYMVTKLQELQVRQGLRRSARGLGLLLYFGEELHLKDTASYAERLLPPLTLTPKEVDQWMEKQIE